MPIPRLSLLMREAKAMQCHSALAPILAPESVLRVLLSEALSSTQANIVCSSPKLLTQPRSNFVSLFVSALHASSSLQLRSAKISFSKPVGLSTDVTQPNARCNCTLL